VGQTLTTTGITEDLKQPLTSGGQTQPDVCESMSNHLLSHTTAGKGLPVWSTLMGEELYELLPEEQACFVYSTDDEGNTGVKIDMDAVDNMRLPARFKLLLLRYRIVLQDN